MDHDRDLSGLFGTVTEIALCGPCSDRLGEEIVGTHRALRRFDEGARFLEEFGRAEEDVSLRGFR